MSIFYRYRCSLENAHVVERLDESAPPPSACVNDGAPIVAGTLTIVDAPLHFGDLQLDAGDELDLTGASVEGLSHQVLLDIGTLSHAQLDAHVADAAMHRSINDAGFAATDLWSASKINAVFSAHADSTANPHAVTAAQVGLGNVPNLKVNLSAVTQPSAANDSTQGYAVGSRWVDTAQGKEYVCVDAASGAAVWVETTVQSDGNNSQGGPLYVFREVRSNATRGGTNETNEWTARELNETHFAAGSDASLNANNHRVTLQPGTYAVDAASVFYRTNTTLLRLYNVSDKALALIGLPCFNPSNTFAVAPLHGVVVVAGAAKTFELQYFTTRRQSNTGLGTPAGAGHDEVYTVLKARKMQ